MGIDPNTGDIPLHTYFAFPYEEKCVSKVKQKTANLVMVVITGEVLKTQWHYCYSQWWQKIKRS